MTSQSPAVSPRHARMLPPPSLPPDSATLRPPRSAFPAALQRALLLVACLLLVAVIGLLDFGTEGHLSFSIFYLVPVAVCAWCCGFSDGALLSLASAAAWHATDLFADPSLPPAVRMWNGVIRFGSLVLISSMVARLHAGILRERPPGPHRRADRRGQRPDLL